MSGSNNLRPPQSTEEARKRGAAGGKKSGEVRRNKKLLRDCIEILLSRRDKIEINGVEMNLTGAEAMALAAFQKALAGDVKAMEFVRDTAGQKPVDKVVTADVDPAVIDDVEEMMRRYADKR